MLNFKGISHVNLNYFHRPLGVHPTVFSLLAITDLH